MSLERIARRYGERLPIVHGPLGKLRDLREVISFSMDAIAPAAIRARPRKITMAITAHCNLRCTGCRYGRDFMPGAQMSLEMARSVIADASAAGVGTLRLYGGEPLLHPDLPQMVASSLSAGISTYVTTNGMLLEQKIDALFESGLRSLTIGYYGTGARYDAYVQRPEKYRRLERGIAAVRQKYGDAVDMQLNFLLMRPSCTVQAVTEAWELARRYRLKLRVDLVHYSLPYFTEGPDRALQFRLEDEAGIRAVTTKLLELKQEDPKRLCESLEGIASIPDWLLLGPAMRVPCDAGKLIWIGADGTVQLCYAAFPLGNLHHDRLGDLIGTEAHDRAARDAFLLNCPNCHCERNDRVTKHLPSRLKYSREAARLLGSASS